MSLIAQIKEERLTGLGEIPQGFLYAKIKNIGNIAAEVNNVPLEPGESKVYPFVGRAYQAIDCGSVVNNNDSVLEIMTIT